MILNRVKIRNFRQYVKVDIDFAKEDGKNFTIIQGRNGTGKTTFLNALSWCLYKEEIHSYKGAKGMSICNNKTKNLAVIGDEIEVRVELEFIDDDQLLSFNRVQGFVKTKDGLSHRSSLDKFEMKTQDGNDIKISENPNYTIEKKIPKEIENYFFFDGGLLDKYFDNKKNNEIKSAVYGISQLNLLENAKNNLEYVKNKYISKQKQISPHLGEASQKINDISNRIQESEEKLERAKKDKKAAEEEVNFIYEELLNKNSQSVKNDARRSKQLDREINSLNKKISKKELNIKKYVLINYPYVLSYEYFNTFIKKGNESIDNGDIPPKIQRSYIQRLLDDGKCICGADLNEDESHRKALEELLEKTNPLSDKARELTSAVDQVESYLIKNIKKYKSTTINSHQELKDLINKREKFISEKKEIDARLKLNPEEEIDRLLKRKDALEKTKTNLVSLIANLESSIERNKVSLGEWKKKLNKEESLNKDFNRYQKKIDICNKSIKALNTIYYSLKEEMREKIQDLTKENFLKISWKEGAFTDIVIHEDYRVGIINNLGEELPPFNLSQGEKLTLGLCFMSALHNISGFDLPIIMDTPLGILDPFMKQNIAKFLPEFNGGKQFVLLVTGSEYTDNFKDTLNRVVGKEYMIQWEVSDAGNESKVV